MGKGRMIRRLGLMVLLGVAGPPATAADRVVVADQTAIKGSVRQVRAMVTPRVETVLSSQTRGRILKLAVDTGDRFKRGDPLVVLDCEITQAEKRKVETELYANRKTHQANARMQASRSISDLEVAISEAAVKRSEAELAMIDARVKMCHIEAPFDGRVTKRSANAYQFVQEGQPILDILDDTSLRLQVVIPSHWLIWLQPGASVTATIDETGKSYPAKVMLLGARIDPASQTLEVWADIDGSREGLLAGMSGMVTFH